MAPKIIDYGFKEAHKKKSVDYLMKKQTRIWFSQFAFNIVTLITIIILSSVVIKMYKKIAQYQPQDGVNGGIRAGMNLTVDQTTTATTKSELDLGDTLYPGQNMYVSQYLESANGCFRARYQMDGNFVITKSINGQPIWASGATVDCRGCVASMQLDGNFVLYLQGQSYWSTNTNNNPGSFLNIQNDGTINILNSAGNYIYTSEIAIHTCN